MIRMLRTAGVVLVRRWPALLAWLLAGILGRYLAIMLASFVAQWSTYLGALLVGLGALAKLLSFVAMFLVMRSELETLGALAPTPADPRRRRSFFLDAVMTATVPFLLFYEIWGYLDEDWIDYARRVTELWLGGAGGEDLPDISVLGASIPAIVTAVVAFGLRWAWARRRDRLPRWTQWPAVLCEVLWTYLFVLMLDDALAAVWNWIQTRVVFGWIGDLRSWLGEVAAPVAQVWTSLEEVGGDVIELVALPFAWITIAGVVYGVAIEAARRRRRRLRAIEAARRGWDRMPVVVRRGATGLWEELTERVVPMGKAFTLALRAGPVLVGAYVLCYSVTLLLEQLLRGGIIRVVGPHDLQTFWQVADTMLFVLIPLIVEPVRLAIVAGAYDTTLEHVVIERSSEREAQEAGADNGDVDVESERPGIGGHDIGDHEFEGRG
ncbi:hypothetical protein GCM10025768_12950 [Microbacterium pseudoresistens]|uniref:Uncharacterized protein n=1 Tax=Microbacterium pseudoresistens TaxID=640634 RepID=A0A7Y9EWD5_9MICO|nr:hypothetical protein [Microbacterium pseudoresistens]NYD55198.1 hypothetical protein [Microbacterium pseudoresistens]